ncbi:MAG TPA: lasso peptide biosynthesis B2 protein [Ktedonobacteraceae bacterium]|nr:lasso peptide biosynthesis B2 protein [Ktedonobacteraceae bacterium]
MNTDERNDGSQRFAPTSFAHVILTDEMGVILDLCSDAFLGLSAVARHIWMYVAKGKTPLEVASLLARRYEVEPGRLLPDVLHFIHMMQERGLLACCDEEWPAPPPPVETITLEGWGSDEIVALPLEIRDARQWQVPERREAFSTLQRVDELLKQVGLKTFAHALMDLPAHRMIRAEDADVQQVADVVMEAAEWLPFKAACLHQCLALAWMLRRRHMHVEVVLGMYTHPFSAHVWLESDGHIVQWKAGMGYSADFRRIEAMSVIFHTGMLTAQAEGQQA